MRYDNTIIIECLDNVYEPAEDSFLLLKIMNVKKGDKVLDMGTGTGIIALHCAAAGAYVTVVDINPAAVRCARRNAKRNELNVKFVRSDLFSNVTGKFDVITFNPPYLPSEDDGADDGAWTGGASGHETLERFLKDAKKHLEEGGAIYTIVSAVSNEMFGFKNIRMLGYSIKRVTRRHYFFEQLNGLKLVGSKSRK